MSGIAINKGAGWTLKGVGWTLLTGSLVFATGASAQNSANMPDAQIEANVLRALASAPELSTQNIQSSTVYGTVTLTGNVHDEALRTKAENLVARAAGVKKVVDELALGDTPPPTDQAAAEPGPDQQEAQPGDQPPPPQGQLQSDGTYAPGPPPQEAGNMPPPAPQQGGQYPGGYGPPDEGQPPAGQQTPNYGPPAGAQQQYPGGYGPPQDENQGPPNGQPQDEGGQPYGPPPSPNGPPARRPLYQNNPQGYAPPGGQEAGLQVTVPAGALLRVRINRGLDSNHIQPGTQFDGIVLSDVAADGAIAIPRGASVQGVVVDAKKSGALKGRGELSLQITSVTLGGTVYPVNTELWQRNSRDKTTHTVNSAVGLGVLGAIIGGVAGGGAGAAVGAGVGGAAGVASSAASPSGRVIVPPEAVLSFRLAQPAVVHTVSEQEMARLAYAAGTGPQPRPRRVRRYNPNYGYYYAPY